MSLPYASTLVCTSSRRVAEDVCCCGVMQFFKDKGIKTVTVYPPATYTSMTTERDDMEPVPEKEAQPSDVAKAAMLVRRNTLSIMIATNKHHAWIWYIY